MNWYSENAIKGKMVEWLDKKGFKIEIPKKDKIHGVDIQRRSIKGCRYWFIEAKGAPSKKYQKGLKKGEEKKKQSLGSQRYHWFLTAIGQIALRMVQKNGKYGIVLPDTKYNRDKASEISLFRKRSKINVFLVSKNDQIWQLTPNSNKFKKV